MLKHVRGCIAAVRSPGGVYKSPWYYNLASLNDASNIIREISGKKLSIRYVEKQNGDVAKTRANIAKAQKKNWRINRGSLFGEGLKRQYLYQSSLTV